MSEIDRLLGALRDAEAGERTPARVEDAVMAAWDADRIGGTAPQVHRARRWLPHAAAALVMFCAALGSQHWTRLHDAPPLLPSMPVHSWRLSSPAAVVPDLWSRSGKSQPVASRRAPTRDADSRLAADRPASADQTQRTLVMVGEPLTPGEAVRVVRMRVAASRLAALGIPAATRRRVDTVDLELLVGEDGVARAIRVGM